MVTSYDELLAHQDTLYHSKNPTRRWLHRTRRDWIVDAIRQAAAEEVGSGRAIEFGPGSGVYLPTLASCFREVVAADVEPAYLERARALSRKHPNLTGQIDDATRTSLPAKSFDLILCTEVVEHMPDSAPALRTFGQLLRPGGVLVLSTPQRFSLLELTAAVALLPGVIDLVRRIYRESVQETGHVNLMTVATVRRQLADAGLVIERTHTSGLYVPLLAEFGGEAGQRLLARAEDAIRGGPLDWTLWTQYYIARRPAETT